MRIIKALLWQDRLRDAGERAREEHSRWLTQALYGRSAGFNYPKIPTRRVDAGGFDKLMSDRRGRRAAANWWQRIFRDDDR